MNLVEVTAVVLHAVPGDIWTVRAKVVSVVAKVHAEYALVGTQLQLTLSKPPHPTLVTRGTMKSGILFRVEVPVDVAEHALDLIGNNVDIDSLVLEFAPTSVRPVAEPCVRVPLSVLRELRSQESTVERTRQALLHAWSQDRRTGKADDENS